MARMYSGRKGKSGSKKPVKKTKPSWVRYGQKELELLIVKLAKEGKQPSHIGLYLRDVYGIPSVKAVLGKQMNQVLKERGLHREIPEDLMALLKRSIQLEKHLEENRKDMTAKRGLLLTDSKIRRLVKYYKQREVLPQDWKFDRESIRLYVQ
ncbi:30S ribosomal protein S15 [Candidatus Woesearchaeota archaeon]|nr:30S ribosomal protein S15 [Candidatus Woesearchaeota archaeon]